MMIVKPQIWTLNTEAIESNTEWGKEWFLPKIDIMVREGVLVPDTRLQAIADAWKAYRAAARSGSDDELVYRRNKYETLLDALAEEER